MWIIPSIFYMPYYPTQRSAEESFWYYINRIDVLLFIVTLTTGALFTTGFADKELMYKITIPCFIISMGLLFVTFTRWMVSTS